MVKLSHFPGAIPSMCVARTETLGYLHPRPQHYMDVCSQLQQLATSTLGKEYPLDKGPF
jgi:hypothetical protein